MFLLLNHRGSLCLAEQANCLFLSGSEPHCPTVVLERAAQQAIVVPSEQWKCFIHYHGIVLADNGTMPLTNV